MSPVDYGLSLMSTNIRRVFSPFSPYIIEIVMHVQILSLLDDGLSHRLRRVFDGVWKGHVGWLAELGQVDSHLFFELLSWRFGRELISLSHNWCYDWLWSRCSCFLLFTSHHLLEFVFVLLSKNSCSLFSLRDEVV